MNFQKELPGYAYLHIDGIERRVEPPVWSDTLVVLHDPSAFDDFYEHSGWDLGIRQAVHQLGMHLNQVDPLGITLELSYRYPGIVMRLTHLPDGLSPLATQSLAPFREQHIAYSDLGMVNDHYQFRRQIARTLARTHFAVGAVRFAHADGEKWAEPLEPIEQPTPEELAQQHLALIVEDKKYRKAAGIS